MHQILKLEAFHQSHTRIPSGNEDSAFDVFGNQEDRPSQEICQKQSLTKFRGENLQLEN